MLIDTHVHLDRLPKPASVDAEIATAREAGVGVFLVPGVRRGGWSTIDALTSKIEGVLPAYGLHPLAAREWDEACCSELRGYLARKEAVAVGEIGLDRDCQVPITLQEEVFRQQLRMAGEERLPVLIHCRKMPGRLIEILKEERSGLAGGILHAFSGSLQTAETAIELGFAIGVGGSLTYPGAKRVLEVARQLPTEAIVIETDAPDMAPHPHRGEMNRPSWLPLVVKCLADIRGWSMEQAAAITTANARRILNL